MLVQIYEVTSPEEASALAELGVDRIGVLVGDGEFPREQSVQAAKRIFSGIPPSSKSSALSLSADLGVVERIVATLAPAILHLGASTDLLRPEHVLQLKRKFEWLIVTRSIPVVNEHSIRLACSYDGIADMLLLDSHRLGDPQIGALGITHDWELDRTIVGSVRIPVMVAGGLGPDNAVEAIRAIRPAGVDSKSKTDKDDLSHTKDLEKVRQFVFLAKSLQQKQPADDQGAER
jgi:phosphoribosylanthranilate isomerase